MNYEQKYLKYKAKYLALKRELEGAGLFYITAGDKVKDKVTGKTGKVTLLKGDQLRVKWDNLDEEAFVPKDSVVRNNLLAKFGRSATKAAVIASEAAKEAYKVSSPKIAAAAAAAARAAQSAASATVSATKSAMNSANAALAGPKDVNAAVKQALLSSETV